MLQSDYYIEIILLTPTRHAVYASDMFNEDTLFLSSSAENHKAESAPCCATLSLQRAMSDNSNSTGSSGSSTNSWTLLSPEVCQRTSSGNWNLKLWVPGYNLEDCHFPCSWIQVHLKYGRSVLAPLSFPWWYSWGNFIFMCKYLSIAVWQAIKDKLFIL